MNYNDSARSMHRLHVVNYDYNLSEKDNSIKDNNLNNPKYFKEYQNTQGENVSSIYSKLGADLRKFSDTSQKQKNRRNKASLNLIQDILSIGSNHFKQFFQPKIKHKKTKRKTQKGIYHSDDIKVLYASDECKMKRKLKRPSIGFRRKCNMFCGKNDEINYDPRYNSWDNSREKCKSRKKSCRIKTCNEQPKKSSLCNSKCNPCNNIVSTTICHETCRPNYGYKMPVCYKIVDFPENNSQYLEREVPKCDCKDIETNTCVPRCKQMGTSYISIAQQGGGDAAATCAATSKDSLQKAECLLKSHDLSDDSKAKACKYNLKILCDPLLFHQNALYLAKVALKYILFGVALIVWSPCIVVLFLCWLVTYPLRPGHVIERRSKSKMHVCRDNNGPGTSCQPNLNDTWSPLIKYINRTANSIAISFSAFRSLIHKDEIKSHCSLSRPLRTLPTSPVQQGNKHCVMLSNPDNKYTLYYSKNKGWVMKSGQLRSRKDDDNNFHSCRRGMQCASEPHCISVNHTNTVGTNIKYSKPSKDIKSCFSCIYHPKYTHQHNNFSRRPIRIKLSNPKSRYYTHKTRNKNLKSISNDVKKKPCHKSLVSAEQQTCEQRSRSWKYMKQIISKTETTCNPSTRNKFCRYCKETKHNICNIIDDVETEIWKYDDRCCEMYIQTLRRKPCFRVYRLCPSLYPLFLMFYKCYENVCHMILLVISACIWCPLLASCYMWYTLFCRCFYL